MATATVEIPEGYEAISAETLFDQIEAIYAEESIGANWSKAARARMRARTNRHYKALSAIGYGYTPVNYVGTDPARIESNRKWVSPAKMICNECGHTYRPRMTGLMRRHVIEKHGKTYADFPSFTAMHDEIKAAA